MSIKSKAYKALEKASRNKYYSEKTGKDAMKGQVYVHDPETGTSYRFVNGKLRPYRDPLKRK